MSGQSMRHGRTLHEYVFNTGAVVVARNSLGILARDLQLRDRQLAGVIQQMASRGMLREGPDYLQLSAKRARATLADVFPQCLRQEGRAA
jgi:hypothetical protein